MGDVTCASCGEPWDTYHLRHDEVHETEAGTQWIYWKLDCEDWEKGQYTLTPAMRDFDNPPPEPEDIEKWEGKLTDFWRKQFGALGWKFGVSMFAILRCPCCKKERIRPDAEDRILERQVIGELMEGDDDGIAVTLEDMEA